MYIIMNLKGGESRQIIDYIVICDNDLCTCGVFCVNYDVTRDYLFMSPSTTGTPKFYSNPRKRKIMVSF